MPKVVFTSFCFFVLALSEALLLTSIQHQIAVTAVHKLRVCPKSKLWRRAEGYLRPIGVHALQ